MASENKFLIYGGLALAGVAAIFGSLYVKNKVLYKPLPKVKTIEITRDLRKALQQVFQLVVSMIERTKGHNLPPEALSYLIEGEDSFNIKLKIREKTEQICKKHGTTAGDYEKSISHYSSDPEVKKSTAILEKDYQLALKAQVNTQLFGDLPQISVDKFFEIAKKKIQQDYLNKLEIIKISKDKSQAQMNSDPVLAAQIQRLMTAGIEDILFKNGLRSQSDSLLQVFEILNSNFEKKDAAFKVKVKNIEALYNQSFDKYIRAYSQTGNEEHLNNLEDQILYKYN